MALPNLHTKLFQSNGSDKLLREDIIPWSESPYGSVPIVSKHFTTASAISSGEAVSTHGCGYKFGENALMVFMDGLCLDEGVHYAEAESGEEITLLFDCQAGVVFEFVAHDGYEYEYEEPDEFVGLKYTVHPTFDETTSYTDSDGNVHTTHNYSTTYCPIDRYSMEGSAAYVTIDWGDGTTEVVYGTDSTSPNYTQVPTHAYEPYSGTYQITITGIIPQPYFGTANQTTTFNNTEELEHNPETLASTYVEDASNVRVHGLISVDAPLPGDYSDVSGMFYSCRLLEHVPGDLFKNCQSATRFNHTFYSTYSLQEIPEGLLSYSDEIKDIGMCFASCGMYTDDGFAEIPANLLEKCTKVTDMSYVFSYSAVNEIPSGFFDSLIEADEFDYCFEACGCTTVPENLFANCTKCTSLFATFYNCPNMEGFTLDLTNVNDVKWANMFAENSGDASNNIVKVTAGSTTEASFQKRDDTNVTLESV